MLVASLLVGGHSLLMHYLALILYVFAQVAGAATYPPNVRLEPSSELMAKWVSYPFDQDTMFIFDTFDDFERLLDEGGVAPDLRQTLRTLVTDRYTKRIFANAKPFFDMPSPTRPFVLIPNDLWDRLPARYLRNTYLYQMEREYGDGTTMNLGPAEDFGPGGFAKLVKRLRPFANGLASANALARLAIVFNGNVTVPVNPATWRYLNRRMRTAQVQSLTDEHPMREGLILDTLPPVPPYIAAHAGKYIDRCANCFNAAVNLLGPAGVLAGQTEDDELEAFLKEHYLVLPADAPTEPGDLMVFREPYRPGWAYKVFNVSIVVGENLIFTKNGMSKFNPFVFNDEAVDLAQNHREHHYTIDVYRHRRPGAYRAACALNLTAG